MPASKPSPCFVLVMLLAAAGPAASSTTIFPVRDNTLFEDNGGASCATGALYSGETFFNESRRAVIAFDVAASVPAGSTILSAELRMNVLRAGGSALPSDIYHFHRLLGSWGETGSSCAAGAGGPASPGDATWSHRFFSTDPWTAPGGDFDATASVAAATPTFGVATWTSTPALVSDVQSWLDNPAGNFGWILIGPESVPRNAREFDSRDGASPPQLIVSFTPPAAGPPEVPDGRLAPPLRLTKLTADGSSLRVDWDPTLCTGDPGHHILFGTRSDFPAVLGGTYGLDGSVCAIGATAPFVWSGAPDPVALDPSGRMLWVLVLANDATTEGSWGRNRALQERNGAGPSGSSGQCGMTTKSVSNTCGQAP